MNIRVFSAGVIATDARKGREQPLTPGDTVDSETAKAHALFDVLGDRLERGRKRRSGSRWLSRGWPAWCLGLAELVHLEEALGAEDMGPLRDEDLDAIWAVYAAGVPLA